MGYNADLVISGKDNTKQAFSSILGSFKEFNQRCAEVSAKANTIKKAFANVQKGLAPITNALKKLGSVLKSIMNAAVKVIKSTISTITKVIKTALTTLLNWFKSALKTVYNTVKSMAKVITALIVAAVAGAIAAVKNYASKEQSTIKLKVSLGDSYATVKKQYEELMRMTTQSRDDVLDVYNDLAGAGFTGDLLEKYAKAIVYVGNLTGEQLKSISEKFISGTGVYTDLKKWGIEVKGLSDSFVDINKVLDVIEPKMEALAAESLSYQTNAIKQDLAQIWETLGSILAGPVKKIAAKISDITKGLGSKELKGLQEWVDELYAKIEPVITKVQKFLWVLINEPKTIWNSIKSLWNNGWAWIKQNFLKNLEWIGHKLEDVIAEAIHTATTDQTLFSGIITGIQRVLDWAGTSLKAAWNTWIADIFNISSEYEIKESDGFFTSIQKALQGVIDGLKFSKLAQNLKDWWSDTVLPTLETTVEWIVSTFSTMLNNILADLADTGFGKFFKLSKSMDANDLWAGIQNYRNNPAMAESYWKQKGYGDQLINMVISLAGRDDIQSASDITEADRTYTGFYTKSYKTYDEIAAENYLEQFPTLYEAGKGVHADIKTIVKAINASSGTEREALIESYGLDTKYITQDIPLFANGGYVNKPTLALIGEAGGEFVIPEKNVETSDPFEGLSKTLAETNATIEDGNKLIQDWMGVLEWEESIEDSVEKPIADSVKMLSDAMNVFKFVDYEEYDRLGYAAGLTTILAGGLVSGLSLSQLSTPWGVPLFGAGVSLVDLGKTMMDNAGVNWTTDPQEAGVKVRMGLEDMQAAAVAVVEGVAAETAAVEESTEAVADETVSIARLIDMLNTPAFNPLDYEDVMPGLPSKLDFKDMIDTGVLSEFNLETTWTSMWEAIDKAYDEGHKDAEEESEEEDSFWKRLKEGFSNFFAGVGSFVSTYATEMFGEGFGGLIEGLTEEDANVWSVLLNTILPLLMEGMSNVATSFQELWEIMSNALYIAGELLGQTLVPLLEYLLPVMQEIAGLFAALAPLLSSVILPIIELVGQALAIIGVYLDGLMPLIAGVSAVLQWVFEVISWIGSGFKSNKKPGSIKDNYNNFMDAYRTTSTNPYSVDTASSNVSSATASYSGDSVIHVHNYFDGSYIVGSGGMRELAQIIRTELQNLDHYAQ